MKTFALIGAAGYIAPRHMAAIAETGNTLVAAFDPNDSVGVLDRYFPEAAFFTEFERFDRHMEKLFRAGKGVDYVSICSPNYLHDAHIRFGLRNAADVICEKPVVLNPWNIDAIEAIEARTDRAAFAILQLRLHPSVARLKQLLAQQPGDFKADIDLTYITARGEWYDVSWKGDENKSGGIATNIGVHFFDLLIWLFGSVKRCEVRTHSAREASGLLELEHAHVRWFLSTDVKSLPPDGQASGRRTFRSLRIGSEEFDLTAGFEQLHTLSYRHILDGTGFRVGESRPAIELVHRIRQCRGKGSVDAFDLG